MKYILTVLIFMVPAVAMSADIVIFSTTTNRVIKTIPSQNPTKFEGREDVLIISDKNAQAVKDFRSLSKLAGEYLVHDRGEIREMTQQEKDTFDLEKDTKRKDAERNRIDAKQLTAMEVVAGLVRQGIIKDEEAFLEEIKKYRGLE